MADLTINSLSVTKGAQWPVDPAVGIVATREDGAIYLEEDGAALPSSTQVGAWLGTPTVQTDFSP